MSRRDLLVVAGEASGDLHGARLVRALRERRPELRFFGVGSDEMAEAGVELLADAREISVVGIVEALGVLRRAKEILDGLVALGERRRPAAAILIDFPDFNLRLARALRWQGIPVVYYVSPQIWAWRRWRIRTIVELVDRMLVLFPFEVGFYRRHGARAVHVGHPLVDEVAPRAQAWDAVPRGQLPARYRIALLPGSRRSEVETLLPVQLEALRQLRKALVYDAVLVKAGAIDRRLVERHLAAFPDLKVEIAESDRFAAVAGAHLALCASGTATLETGLLGTPLIMVYKLAPVTWGMARALVRVPHASLVNLVLGREAIPELVQGDATGETVARHAAALLRDREAVDAMRERLAELRGRLGSPGASERAADEVLSYLDALPGAA